MADVDLTMLLYEGKQYEVKEINISENGVMTAKFGPVDAPRRDTEREAFAKAAMAPLPGTPVTAFMPHAIDTTDAKKLSNTPAKNADGVERERVSPLAALDPSELHVELRKWLEHIAAAVQRDDTNAVFLNLQRCEAAIADWNRQIPDRCEAERYLVRRVRAATVKEFLTWLKDNERLGTMEWQWNPFLFVATKLEELERQRQEGDDTWYLDDDVRGGYAGEG